MRNGELRRYAAGFAASALMAGLTVFVTGPSPAADHGRERRGIIETRVLPVLGSFAARFRKEPVSYFNLTDDEELLRRQAGHLVAPPHARDWLHQLAARIQRYRLTVPLDRHLSPDAYYAYLRSDRFRSTAGRYRRISADIAADAVLIPPFFATAGQVMAADVLRLEAAAVYYDPDPDRISLQGPVPRPLASVQAAADARVYENRELVDWAERAVEFRIESYRRAIERLTIEEPDGRAGLADGELQRLELIFRKARIARFQPAVPQTYSRRSRYMSGAGVGNRSGDQFDAPVPQK